MAIGITGAGGRLGAALVAAARGGAALVAAGQRGAGAAGPAAVLAWGRDAFDLDDPGKVGLTLATLAALAGAAEGRPLVIHAAAWTDVDGCAREPELALRRNGEATGILARACAERGVDLLVVSTNEVFDGTRTDGTPYGPGDPTSPANPYGASKLAGERAAAEAYARSGAGGRLGIVRTAWLFGPGRPDFPAKIAAAARRAGAAGEPLRVVGDEFGNPTYVRDLAAAILGLAATDRVEGVHHVVNAGTASRADWARDVLTRLGIEVELREVGLDDFPRPSRPPRRAILAPTALPVGAVVADGHLRPWPAAMTDYEPELRQREVG